MFVNVNALTLSHFSSSFESTSLVLSLLINFLEIFASGYCTFGS